MKTSNKLFAVINTAIAVVLIFMLCGCNYSILYDAFGPSYIEDEDMWCLEGRDLHMYEYSEKVRIEHRFCEGDQLLVKEENEDTEGEFFDSGFCMLRGYFEKFAWSDYKLFVLRYDTYYEIDIKEYEPPIFDFDGEYTYTLTEYTEAEFQKKYPDNASFDWLVYLWEYDKSQAEINSAKKAIQKATPFEIPENAEIMRYSTYGGERFRTALRLEYYTISQELIEAVSSFDSFLGLTVTLDEDTGVMYIGNW